MQTPPQSPAQALTKGLALPASYQCLLDPIRPESPCGDDLEYDPKYMELFIRIIPKEKKIISGIVGSERLESEFEPIRWAELENDCLELLTRSKDLRLLIVLTRCRVQQAQATGLLQGLYLLEYTLRNWPEYCYPLLTSEGEPDPLLRSDALMSLAENQGILADIRRLSLNGSGGLRLEVREAERSFSLPLPEGALPPESMRHRLEELAARRHADYNALIDALALARSIAELAQTQLGVDAPDLDPLVSLLARLEVRSNAHATQAESPHSTDTAPLYSGTDSELSSSEMFAPAGLGETADAHETHSSHQHMLVDSSSNVHIHAQHAQFALENNASLAYRIANRHSAREHIRDIRLWFEENEPSSPVIVLLRQAEQMVGKRFAEIVHCLPDDLLQKWETEDL